jgi:4-hydroxybenzoate polyprenyltransferase
LPRKIAVNGETAGRRSTYALQVGTRTSGSGPFVSAIDSVRRNRIYLWPGAAFILVALPPWYGSTPNWEAVPSITLAGFGLYQLNRVFDVVEDAINDPGGLEPMTGAGAATRNAAVGAIVASLLMSTALMNPLATATLSMMLLLGVLYSVPFLRRGPGRPRRLKQLATFKNAIPGVVWPVTTVLYPAISRPGVRLLPLLLVMTGLASIILTIEVAWDIRDVLGDRAAGIRTLATIMGSHRALLIPFLASGTQALAIVDLVYFGAIPPVWLLPAALVTLAPVVAFLWRDALARNRDRSHLLVLVNMLALFPMYLVGRWAV